MPLSLMPACDYNTSQIYRNSVVSVGDTQNFISSLQKSVIATAY